MFRIHNSYCISNHEGWKCPTTPTGNALLSSLENKELKWGREDCCWKCNDYNDYHIAGGVEDTSIRGFFVWSSLFENCLHLPGFFYTRSLYSFVSVFRKNRTLCNSVLLIQSKVMRFIYISSQSKSHLLSWSIKMSQLGSFFVSSPH